AMRSPSGDQERGPSLPMWPSASSSRLVAISHTLTFPSWLLSASRLLSGDQDTALNHFCHGRVSGSTPRWRVSGSAPSTAFHTLAIPSSLPVASRFPSGDQHTQETGLVWPKVSSFRPLDISHTFAVPSRLVVASRSPSGDQDTALLPSVGPWNVG